MSSREIDSLLTEEDMDKIETTLWDTAHEPNLSLDEARDEQESSVMAPEDLEVEEVLMEGSSAMSAQVPSVVCDNITKPKRIKVKCQHNRDRFRCKECDGVSVCPHGNIRTYCKECQGASICQHNKRKYDCVECDGAAFCGHQRFKKVCPLCINIDKSVRCEVHEGILKYKCRECAGKDFCIHSNLTVRCRSCNISEVTVKKRVYTKRPAATVVTVEKQVHTQESFATIVASEKQVTTQEPDAAVFSHGFCEHGMKRIYCKRCGGGVICPHGLLKRTCFSCGGPEGCIHGRRKYDCVECEGPSVCYHKRIHRSCVVCKHVKSNVMCTIHIDTPQYKCKECGVKD